MSNSFFLLQYLTFIIKQIFNRPIICPKDGPVRIVFLIVFGDTSKYYFIGKEEIIMPTEKCYNYNEKQLHLLQNLIQTSFLCFFPQQKGGLLEPSFTVLITYLFMYLTIFLFIFYEFIY